MDSIAPEILHLMSLMCIHWITKSGFRLLGMLESMTADKVLVSYYIQFINIKEKELEFFSFFLFFGILM